MSIEYRAVVAFGKGFDNIQDAIDHMIERQVITEDEADDFESNHEIDGIQWIPYDRSGILGIEINVYQLCNHSNEIKTDCEKIHALIGDCTMHKFVNSY
jgi:hypothetical protein